MAVESTPEVDFRVSLRNAKDVTEVCTFVATPDLIETRNVNYKTIDPVHAPGQILAYSATTSRNFNISGIKLISRTQDEAAINLDKLWMLRSWTMPQFGQSTITEKQRNIREGLAKPGRFTENRLKFLRDNPNAQVEKLGAERRGEPPVVLHLSAYSKGSDRGATPGGKNNAAGHINRVPVVIQNMSIPYPSDVDYIPAAVSGVPMPTIMVLDITLMETHSPREYEKFSLSSFRNGTLAGF